MMLSLSEAVIGYVTLQEQLTQEDYDQAVVTSERLLYLSTADITALKCKIICLIYLRRYDEALSLALRGAQIEKNYFSFELAYIYYTLNFLEQAKSHCKDIKSITIQELQVLGQVYYRLDEFDNATKVYESLLSLQAYVHDGVEEVEIRTNLTASRAQATNLKAASRKFKSSGEEVNYEIEFNRAYAFAQMGNFNKSDNCLQACEKLVLEHDFDEEGSMASMKNELCIITVQRAVIAHMKGFFQNATEIYADTLRTNDGNSPAMSVANNNLIVLREDHDMFDSYRRMKSILEGKLSSLQKRTVSMNRALILMAMGKESELIKVIEANNDDQRMRFAWAAWLYRKNRKNECLDSLQTIIEKVGEKDALEVKLAKAQVLISMDHIEHAICEINSIGHMRQSPGITATLIGMYNEAGNKRAAAAAFESALSAATDPHHRIALVCSRALEHMRRGCFDLALDAFEIIFNERSMLGSKHEIVYSQYLIASYLARSNIDLKKCVSLPVVSDFSADMNALEAIASTVCREQIVTSGSLCNRDSIAQEYSAEKGRYPLEMKTNLSGKRNENKIHRRRVARRQKYLLKMNAMHKYDAHNPIPKRDPQLWIPRAMRNSTKHRRSRRAEKHLSGGAQGAGDFMAKDLRKFDAKARVDAANN
jgi:tetratricopeptide (TPR) repeat protein